MIRTQKHKEDKGTNGQLMESSLITSDEKQPEHIYDNADFFPTLPNAAYGTGGKTLCWQTLCILKMRLFW